MKTKTGSSRLALLAIALTVAFVTQPVFGQGSPPNQIVFTENSSSSLNVTFNGSTSGVTVQNISPDHWDVTFPAGVANLGTVATWEEPGNSSFNRITFTTFTSAGVESDVSGCCAPADGFTYNFTSDVTFHDHGDVATVPDTGSTFVLLCGSLLALLGAARFRTRQLA